MQDGGLHPPYGKPAGALHSNDVQQCYLRLNQADKANNQAGNALSPESNLFQQSGSFSMPLALSFGSC